jgi:putative restriction endonuclease
VRPSGEYRWWSLWSTGWSTPEGFVWQMLPQVAEALERLSWVAATGAAFSLSDEVTPTAVLRQGAVVQITVNAYERSAEARRRCIEHHGTACGICETDLGNVYGDVARGFIHVHHLTPLAQVGGDYIVDPIRDLVPVCPNCHAVMHLRKAPESPYSPDELRAMLARARTA